MRRQRDIDDNGIWWTPLRSTNLLARLRYLLAEGFDVAEACRIVNDELGIPDVKVGRVVRGGGMGRLR